MTFEELPLPDYDQLALGDIRHRVRSLDEGQLRALIEHEHAHGDRVPVLEVLQARLNELENGAEPSPGDPTRAPDVSGGHGGSTVQPTTAAEPSTPLRHGVAEQTPARGRP
ncbi:hypothetical protein [Nocardia suismassiliense]|uniref:hypothetical protein n=1 Tax=Nocardia suismassiliense TaxID=2077092 RepID=UPI000D1E2C12|nr:hypothetical protein [Nocardia suismassiliense]